MVKIKINGKFIEVQECRSSWSKFRGLMFRSNPKPLLFAFEKPTRISIHSFFCSKFLAVWLLNGKIVDERVISPFTFSARPKKPFTELVEIPLKKNNTKF